MARNRQFIGTTDPQDAWLKAEAARLGISVPDLIRRIIDDYRARPPVEYRSPS